MKKDLLGYLYVSASAVCFGLLSIIGKFLYAAGLNAWQVMALQSITASLLLLTGVALVRPALFRVSHAMLLRLFVQGIGGSLLTGLFFFQALEQLDASLSILLLYAYPALVTIGAAVFLRQRLTRIRLVSLILTLLGTAMAAGFLPLGQVTASPRGIAFGLAAAGAYAFYILYGEVNLRDTDPWTITLYTQVSSTLGLVLIRHPALIFPAGITPVLAGYGLLIAVLCSIAPFYLLLQGISRIGGSRASIVSTLELPMTVLLARVVLGEAVSRWNLAGGALILASIYLLRGDPEAKTGEASGVDLVRA